MYGGAAESLRVRRLLRHLRRASPLGLAGLLLFLCAYAEDEPRRLGLSVRWRTRTTDWLSKSLALWCGSDENLSEHQTGMEGRAWRGWPSGARLYFDVIPATYYAARSTSSLWPTPSRSIVRRTPTTKRSALPPSGYVEQRRLLGVREQAFYGLRRSSGGRRRVRGHLGKAIGGSPPEVTNERLLRLQKALERARKPRQGNFRALWYP